MANVKERPAFHVVDGLQVPAIFSVDNVRSAMRYRPHPDDVILASYPKCGTTWSQHMLALIFKKGVPITSAMEFFAVAPFLEATGAVAVKDMKRPGAIKVHLPFHLMQHSPEAKYVYVCRNPKDCCVSYFYHVKNLVGYNYNGSFDDFFELFISGNIDYGDYFDHVLGWYEHRNDPNILFVTYEEMKVDPKAAALKFASFLGKEYSDSLKNPEVLEGVIQFSSFNYLKQKVNTTFEEIYEMDPEAIRNDSNLPEGLKTMFLKINEMAKLMGENRPVTNFVRKGIIGDWRNHFSPGQNNRMNEKISHKLKGTELVDLWEDYM